MTPFLDTLRELRYTLRGLRRLPAFRLTVIVTLALGIGANTAMFSVVDRLMFRPHAYLRDPATAHRIYWQWRERDVTRTIMSTQYARYLDLQRWTTSFSQMAAFSERPLAIGEGESAREYRVGTLLFRQSTRDPEVYMGVAALMILVAAAASALPALRAANSDPVSALRAE